MIKPLVAPEKTAKNRRSRSGEGAAESDWQSDANLRLLMENSADVIVRVGPDMRHRIVSPSSLQLFGFRPEEMIGRHLSEFIHPDDMDLVAAQVALAEAGTESTDGPKLRIRFRRKDGTFIWVEPNVRELRDPETGRVTDAVVVLRDATRQKELEDQLAALAFKDGLTGLANRRAFDEAFDKEWSRTLRRGTEMSLVMLDIDRFKQFNDHYGHQAGDDCLRAVAQAIAGVARRPEDLTARYGGEEIVIVLPDTNAAGAIKVAEAARAAVEALRVPHAANSSGGGFLTVSAGVATALSRVGGTMRMPESLLAAADGALYTAKREGRNRVHSALLLAPDRSTATRAAGT